MLDRDLYNRLVAHVHFRDIFIKDLKVNRHPVIPTEGDLEVDVQMNPVLQKATDKNIIAAVYFKVVAETKDKVEVFNIEFEYVTLYMIDGQSPLNEKEIQLVSEDFVENNVPINVWPFARELIADLSNRMSVPRLLIGMYRQLPLEEMEEGADD